MSFTWKNGAACRRFGVSEAIEEVSYYLYPPQTLTLTGDFSAKVYGPLLNNTEYKGRGCNAKSATTAITPFYKAPTRSPSSQVYHGITKTLDFLLTLPDHILSQDRPQL